MAERQGFEPWEGINPQRFSRPPHSTALPPLRQAHYFNLLGLKCNLLDSQRLTDNQLKGKKANGA